MLEKAIHVEGWTLRNRATSDNVNMVFISLI